MPTQPAFDGAMLERLPTVLAIPLQAFAKATSAEQRLHRLCDAVEILTRFCAVLAVAEARLPAAPHQLPEPLVKALGPAIQTPTFARWLGMVGDLADFLARDRGNPLVLPALPRFIRDVLLKTAPPGNRCLDGSILELRNTLAHGGAMSAAMAEYLLSGDPTGLPRGVRPSVHATTVAEEAAADQDESPPAPTAFHGWEAVLGDAVKGLADLLAGSRICSFDGEAARPLTVLEPSGVVEELSADLRLALRQLQLQRHVLLLRDGRWLDLWPLCDHGKARLLSLRGPLESDGDAPLLYYRGEPQRLLYAAFGATPPVGERGDAVADFEALFRPTSRKESAAEIVLDFTEELRRDSDQLIGRAAELQHIKEVLGKTAADVLWLSGTGGIGKSFLTARVALTRRNDPRRWCCIPWRFRVSDADRSNPNTFLRHAITSLAQWPPLGRPDIRPDLDSNKLPAQLDELLRAAAQLQPAGRNPLPPRVLFVLDGMDEAARLHPDLLEWPFRFAYPNVVWLCAGRPEGATDKAFAPERCMHLFPGGLLPMGAGDVRALLYQELGEQKYELLGLDRRDASGNVTNPLVEAIVEKSEGLPLYIRFLVEDLLTGHFELTGRLKNKLPQGLAAYYEDLLERTGIDDVQGMLPKLLAAIVWAQGPVAEELLIVLLRRLENVQPEEEERLRADIRQGLQRVASMVRQAPLPEGGFGYEPYHATFRDHFRASTARLGRTNSRAREAFVALTKDWRQVAEPAARRYVFRHGPQHLLDENGHEDLYALGRDEDFLRAQAEELPEEAEAPLRTLQAALTAAGRRDNAAGMTEFLLRHAEQTRALQNESPLAALRRGNLERALSLADLADAERAVVHRLLLAWELNDQGRVAEARQVLDQLAQRDLPKLAKEFCSIAVESLAGIGRSFPTTATDLGCRLLSECEQMQPGQALIEEGLLAQEGKFPTRRALETRHIRMDPYEANKYLRDLSARLVADRELDLTDLAKPLGIELHPKRSKDLVEVAAAQARAGQAEEAHATFGQALQEAKAIENASSRHDALTKIAAAQAGGGQAEEARATFEQALLTSRAIEGPCVQSRSTALREIEAAQAGAGQARAACGSPAEDLGRRWENAIDALVWYSDALRAKAHEQGRAGQVVAALETVLAIETPNDRLNVLVDVAAKLVAGRSEIRAAQVFLQEAVKALDTVPNDEKRADLLERLAQMLVEIGLPHQAIATARLIPFEREYHLPAVIESLLQANDRTAFKELLIPCAAHLKSAWAVCGLLAGAYPEQATAIAQVALQFGRAPN